MSATLTDAEREALAGACDAMCDFGETWIRFLRNGNEDVLLTAVEAIVAARLTEAAERIEAERRARTVPEETGALVCAARIVRALAEGGDPR